LREFEQRASINPLQPDLFASALSSAAEAQEPPTSPAIDRLRAIDPDRLTPREALDALYELKALLP
jgi:DNA mismatch repair protein MutS